MVTATAAELLGFEGVSTRVESIRFEQLDADGNIVGELHPEPGASVSWSANAEVPRTLTGLRLPPSEVAALDIYAHRIRPTWVLGGVTTGYPLGVFLVGSTSLQRSSAGDSRLVTGVDQSAILRYGGRSSFGLKVGDSLGAALARLVNQAGIMNPAIEFANVTAAATPPVWSAGTPRRTIADELAQMLGFVRPYFDAAGRFRCHTAPDAQAQAPDITLRAGGNIVVDTWDQADDMLDRPNVFVCRGTGASAAYELPAANPLSVSRRGYEVVRHIAEPGIGTADACYAMARADAARVTRPVKTVDVVTTPDPRHDAWTVVELAGEMYLETAWSLELAPGGAHRHKLVQVVL